MPEPTQPSSTEPTGSPSKPTEPSTTPSGGDVDLTKLDSDQLQKVLENPNLFKLPRIKEALDAQKELKTVKDKQSEAERKQLEENKQWEELANKNAGEVESLKKQLQDRDITSALTNKLVGKNVVDLDGALKLVDRTAITIDDNGTVSGVDEALKSLEESKAYLFNNQGQPTNVGSPNNPAGSQVPANGRYKFKESQITSTFYQKNKAEVDEAYRMGLIEPDGPPTSQ